MRIVLAPDSFKESMTAAQAAAAMTRGVRAVHPDADCVEVPMADGGEGTAEALIAALRGEWRTVVTTDPLGRPLVARYGLAPDGLAVIEVAAAVGIGLVQPAERDVMRATSVGVADLVADAVTGRLSRGARTGPPRHRQMALELQSLPAPPAWCSVTGSPWRFGMQPISPTPVSAMGSSDPARWTGCGIGTSSTVQSSQRPSPKGPPSSMWEVAQDSRASVSPSLGRTCLSPSWSRWNAAPLGCGRSATTSVWTP